MSRHKYPYTYAWKNNPKRAAFYGRPCRIVTRGALNTIWLEFKNGENLITSGNSIRRRRPRKITLDIPFR